MAEGFQDREKICPVCGGTSQRLISNTSFVLKGGGWYASGYSKESGGNGKKDVPSSPAPDTSTSSAS
jgi:predicted nucleic acid-binding Zn ribbon protein